MSYLNITQLLYRYLKSPTDTCFRDVQNLQATEETQGKTYLRLVGNGWVAGGMG